MIKYANNKMTANQVAKVILADKLEIGIEYWIEDCLLEVDKLTEKEKQDIQRQLFKRANSIVKYLGLDYKFTQREVY